MSNYVFSIIDILPYFIILAVLLIVNNYKMAVKNKLFVFFIISFILSALRYGIGYDYDGYKDIINGELNEHALERFEPLSQVMVYIARATHYQVFFIIGSFLTIFPVYKICAKYSLNPTLSFIVYFLHPLLYLNSYSIVRNAIAFSFVLYAFCILLEKKYIKSLIIIFIAALFHKSAFVGLLIYPICFIKSSRLLYLSLYISSFLISLLVSLIIAQYAESFMLIASADDYMNRESEGGGTMTFIVNGLCIINLLLWPKISKCGSNASKLLAMYCVGTSFWNVFLIFNITLASRLYLLFAYTIILIAPYYYLSFAFQKRSLALRIVKMFFILLFCSYFYINVSSFLRQPSKMSNIPYQTIFWGQDFSNLN